MKIKIDEIKPDLLPEMLRKVDEWLCDKWSPVLWGERCGNHKTSDCPAATCSDCQYRQAPPFTTSIHAALGLCEQIKTICITCGVGCERKHSVWWSTQESLCIEECCEGFSDIPCAIIRALLGSQNISEVEI